LSVLIEIVRPFFAVLNVTSAAPPQRTRTTHTWIVGLRKPPVGPRARIAVDGRSAPETRK
jgi:hypothetical protein